MCLIHLSIGWKKLNTLSKFETAVHLISRSTSTMRSSAPNSALGNDSYDHTTQVRNAMLTAWCHSRERFPAANSTLRRKLGRETLVERPYY